MKHYYGRRTTYYSTLLPDFIQQYADNYNGNPADKAQAIKDYEAHLIAKHMLRVQKLLTEKRRRLIIKYMDELVEQLETAQRVADLEEDMWTSVEP